MLLGAVYLCVPEYESTQIPVAQTQLAVWLYKCNPHPVSNPSTIQIQLAKPNEPKVTD